jgi:hypothetical protein
MNGKKFLVIGLLGLFMISMFASIAVAQDEVNPEAEKFFGNAVGGVGDVFGKLFGETYGTGFWELAAIKFLFFLLLLMVILAVSDSIPLLSESNAWIKWSISAIVSYLSVMYITPSDFYTILVSYTTMAIVITSVIPLAIIFAIVYKLSSEPSAGKIILQKLLLGLYAIILAWRIAQIWVFKPTGIEIPTFAIPLYGGTLLIVLLLIIFNNTVRHFLFSSKVKGYIEVAGTLNKQEMLGQAILLEKKAAALEESGASEMASQLRQAATRIKTHASKMEGLQ